MRPLLDCRELTLRAGARELVANLSFVVNAGERWAVLGPNGAGKTTLLLALAGVRRADAGRVELAGRPIADWRVDALAERRALVTDRWIDPFAASALDTVLTARYRYDGADDDGERLAREALATVDCAELAERDVRTLSRGERQRVAIATAIAQATPLVLLDEPIAHQDPRHQSLVLTRLAQLADRTLIASMHDVNAAAAFATHALLLSGHGAWRAGPACETLRPELLSELFATRIDVVRADGRCLFFAAGPDD
ncbi:MAG: ABC transporter ATP-binding protein [Burkholderiaceae bacterium]